MTRKEIIMFDSEAYSQKKVLEFYNKKFGHEYNEINDGNKSTIIGKIINEYFGKLSDWDWSDYSDSIRVLSCCSYLMTLDELNTEGLDISFFDSICHGLRMAGESDEIGYDFKGISTIEKNAELLPFEYLVRIFKHEEFIIDGNVDTYFRTKVVQRLIKCSSVTEKEKMQLKFRYYYSYQLLKLLVRKFRNYFATKNSDYKYKLLEEVEREKNIEINRDIFLFALQNDNDDILYIKNDRTLNGIFLSITPNTDIDNMSDYVFDMRILLDLETNKPFIKIDCSRGYKEDDLYIYLNDNWDEISADDLSKIDGILKKTLFLGMNVKTENFEIICFHCKGVNGLPERTVYFQNDFVISTSDENTINVSVNESVRKMPEGFFGKSIRNICAVIGKNGSGKSTVFKSILHTPIFGNNISDIALSDEKYLIIYKIGKNYYYSKSDGIKIKYDNQINISEYSEPSNTNICYISNTFDPFALEFDDRTYEMTDGNKLSGYIDLSTDHMIQSMIDIYADQNYDTKDSGSGLKVYQNREKERIYNLKKYITENADTINLDVLKLKALDDNNLDICPRMSSGEYARWSLFGRILSIFYRGDTLESSLPEIQKRDNYILIFDEAELYMHPEWQRSLINDIIEFLEAINKDERFFSNMTLLFSSNSPFLMSDLPADKIQLFEADDTELKNTFGQNIYTILQDRFFMSRGTLGEFSRKCIDKALGDSSDKEYLGYVYDITGDKLIKHYLKLKLQENNSQENDDV